MDKQSEFDDAKRGAWVKSKRAIGGFVFEIAVFRGNGFAQECLKEMQAIVNEWECEQTRADIQNAFS